MSATTTRHLIAPTIATGVLMAGYLLLRPYGDVEQGSAMAEAFASPAWVTAHILGALALASFARLALRVADLSDSTTARIGRFTGLAGAILVLPYYGAETFGLHAVGSRALTDPATLELVDPIRNQPVALTMFGLGLVLLAVAAVCVGRVLGRPAWPLAAAMALVLPQYFLSPIARMGFGVATLVAAVILVRHLWTNVPSERVDAAAPVTPEPVR